MKKRKCEKISTCVFSFFTLSFSSIVVEKEALLPGARASLPAERDSAKTTIANKYLEI